MKLSEAIRLGAMLSPQGYDGDVDGETRCALAAACDAVGIKGIPGRSYSRDRLVVNYREVEKRFPITSNLTTCPCHECNVSGKRMIIVTIVWHLNDFHRRTREQIADWVETVEAQQAGSNTLAQVVVSPEMVTV